MHSCLRVALHRSYGDRSGLCCCSILAGHGCQGRLPLLLQVHSGQVGFLCHSYWRQHCRPRGCRRRAASWSAPLGWRPTLPGRCVLELSCSSARGGPPRQAAEQGWVGSFG